MGFDMLRLGLAALLWLAAGAVAHAAEASTRAWVAAAVLALAVQWGFDTAERLWGRGRPRPAPPD